MAFNFGSKFEIAFVEGVRTFERSIEPIVDRRELLENRSIVRSIEPFTSDQFDSKLAKIYPKSESDLQYHL